MLDFSSQVLHRLCTLGKVSDIFYTLNKRCWRQRANWGYSCVGIPLYSPLHLFSWFRVSRWIWSSSIWPGWLANELQDEPVSTSWALVHASVVDFYAGPGDPPQKSNFTDGAIVPAQQSNVWLEASPQNGCQGLWWCFQPNIMLPTKQAELWNLCLSFSASVFNYQL